MIMTITTTAIIPPITPPAITPVLLPPLLLSLPNKPNTMLVISITKAYGHKYTFTLYV